MPKLLLDKKEFNFTENNFPILIHGEDKSGASLYTITTAVDFYKQNLKIIFLCGYEQAKEEFVKQVGTIDDKIIFFVKEEVEEFRKLLTKSDDIIIIIKNIELFGENIFDLVSEKTKLIISGDITKCSFVNKILEKPFKTKIFFSKLKDINIPQLQKYEAYLLSDNLSGIATLSLS